MQGHKSISLTCFVRVFPMTAMIFTRHRRYIPLMVCLVFLSLSAQSSLQAQETYFPPGDIAQWESEDPEALGWNTEKLDEMLDWLGDHETRAFVILKDGKLVVEEYYGLFGRESEWYWASAGKAVTAFIIGALEKQGKMNIHNPTSDYLGEGWTSLTPEQEESVTLWHQLTMTTGFDFEVENQSCTDPECLTYREEPGEQWYYHNAPYTLLTHAAEAAADTSLNVITEQVFKDVPGMELRYADGQLSSYNRVVVSTALDMARFGLFVSRGASWDNADPLLDQEYYDNMLTPSQELNPSYGYLWWLNDQDSFIPPGFRNGIPRSITPEAPADMVSALGLNTQILSIVPSENLVIVRMGRDPGSLFDFKSEKWERLSEVIQVSTSAEDAQTASGYNLMQNTPNPFNPATSITFTIPSAGPVTLEVYDMTGRQITTLSDDFKEAGTHTVWFDASGLSSGTYLYRLQTTEGTLSRIMTVIN